MGRKKRFEGETKIVGFRIPLDKEAIFKTNVYHNLSQLLTVNASMNNDDASILRKMIPAFIMKNIELELDDREIARVKELYEGI